MFFSEQAIDIRAENVKLQTPVSSIVQITIYGKFTCEFFSESTHAQHKFEIWYRADQTGFVILHEVQSAWLPISVHCLASLCG